MPDATPDKQGNSKLSGPVKITITMIFGTILLLFTIYILFPNSDNIEIGFPDGKLKVKIENNKINYKSLLDSMFTDEFARAGLLSWLKSKNIYDVSDPDLVQKFADIFPNISQEPVDKKAERLESLLDKYKVIKDLRNLADHKDPPFQYVGKKVIIGIPLLENQPRDNFVNVGFESEFSNKRIIIVNPLNNKQIELKGNPAFHKIGDELFQLNNAQAGALFSKVISTDSAVAYIVPNAQ